MEGFIEKRSLFLFLLTLPGSLWSLQATFTPVEQKLNDLPDHLHVISSVINQPGSVVERTSREKEEESVSVLILHSFRAAISYYFNLFQLMD